MLRLAGMGGDGEREFRLGEAVAVGRAALDQRQPLDGLDRGAREHRPLDIPDREHHGTIGIDDDGRAAMARFDGVAAGHFGEDGVFHGRLQAPASGALLFAPRAPPVKSSGATARLLPRWRPWTRPRPPPTTKPNTTTARACRSIPASSRDGRPTPPPIARPRRANSACAMARASGSATTCSSRRRAGAMRSSCSSMAATGRRWTAASSRIWPAG